MNAHNTPSQNQQEHMSSHPLNSDDGCELMSLSRTTDIITLYDCPVCGSLFTSEHDLGKHACEGSIEKPQNVATKRTKDSSRKSLTAIKPKPKSLKPSPIPSTTLNSGEFSSMKENSGDLTFHLSDSLGDIPTQIEIITSSGDFGSSSNFPSIIIDGIQIPTIPVNLLSAVQHDGSCSKDSLDMVKGNKLLSSVNLRDLTDRE